ncbi:MAG: hypothetical protein CMJ18_25515 [Phycisphaeraceae bacterium]|nr:hypothetical protein [Phycisphaeraceae bacterium]
MNTRMMLSAAALLAVGLVAVPASADTLFLDGFSNHTSGNSINGVNDWIQRPLGGTEELQINDTGSFPAPGMIGNYVDGTIGSSDGAASLNDAGLTGGMDPTMEYVLSWTHHALDNTSNVEIGFKSGTSPNGPRIVLDGQFNGNGGRVLWRGPTISDDTQGWVGDNTTHVFEIVVNSSSVQMLIDGQATGGGPMDAATMAQFDGIFIFHDHSGGRDAGYIDNIMLTPEPGTLALLGLGALAALRRRRLAVL